MQRVIAVLMAVVITIGVCVGYVSYKSSELAQAPTSPQNSPTTITEQTTLPPGYRIQINAKTGRYRICTDNCSSVDIESKEEAISIAWAVWHQIHDDPNANWSDVK